MLYDALRVLLVDEGPLENLFLDRLPPGQTAEVDVAHIRQGGGAPQRYLGLTPVMDGPTGVMHDGGVLWNETTVQFRVRGEDPENPEPVEEAADSIRDVLIQYAGTSVVKADEEIIRCELTASPYFYGQDEQERVIAALTVEVWHRPMS